MGWRDWYVTNSARIFADAANHTLTLSLPGWPTAGTKYQAAVPAVDSAARFYTQGICGMVDWGFNAFFFEAFDEPWKPVSIGQDGSGADETHWGGMDANRTAKYNLKC